MIARFLILLLTLVWFSIAVFAKDDNEQNTTNEQNTDNSITNSNTGVSKRARVKTLEEFIPSEEISADKPVTFPNDI